MEKIKKGFLSLSFYLSTNGIRGLNFLIGNDQKDHDRSKKRKNNKNQK